MTVPDVKEEKTGKLHLQTILETAGDNSRIDGGAEGSSSQDDNQPNKTPQISSNKIAEVEEVGNEFEN